MSLDLLNLPAWREVAPTQPRNLRPYLHRRQHSARIAALLATIRPLPSVVTRTGSPDRGLKATLFLQEFLRRWEDQIRIGQCLSDGQVRHDTAVDLSHDL
jgi:hypothetical protein